MDVFTLGEALVCFSPSVGSESSEGSYLRSVGGAEMNTAVGLARLGSTVAWFSRVSADRLGDVVMAALEHEGVDLSTVQRTPDAPTGVMIKERPSDHHTEVEYYRAGSAASQLDEADAPARAVSEARLVHLTGISMAIGAGPAALARRVIRDAVECHVPVSFDPNFRPSLIDEEAAIALYRGILPSIDHLLCNEAEAMMIAGTATPQSALEVLRGTGPSAVVIKQGARGILAEVDGVRYSQSVHPAPNPVDPVGAGDAFNAGWIHAVLGGLPVQRGLELGAFVASQVVQHPGDYEGFPDAARVEEWMRTQPANETEGALRG